MNLNWSICVIVAYLCGATPFALLLGRLKGVDVRKHGSGNVGATNLGRVLGRRWGILCFILDVLKGAMPVAGAGLWMHWWGRDNTALQQWQWLAVAAAAMLGHIFPFWLKFKGGKGVATGFGVMLGVWPMLTLPALAGAITWAAIALIWRYISLASVVAAMLLPVYVALVAMLSGRPITGQLPFLALTAAMALLVILRHRANLSRLLAGTEPKFGKRN
ncbi:MAG: glycerol-3-phosphate 1-O-acyltransferase PlsY [Phycisphaeraceae bacterium]|nr:glycerol-3-phosphate 1-O-acyltransferase PlsY [Phycisphaeraceae bacterium]